MLLKAALTTPQYLASMNAWPTFSAIVGTQDVVSNQIIAFSDGMISNRFSFVIVSQASKLCSECVSVDHDVTNSGTLHQLGRSWSLSEVGQFQTLSTALDLCGRQTSI